MTNRLIKSLSSRSISKPDDTCERQHCPTSKQRQHNCPLIVTCRSCSFHKHYNITIQCSSCFAQRLANRLFRYSFIIPYCPILFRFFSDFFVNLVYVEQAISGETTEKLGILTRRCVQIRNSALFL